MYCVRKVAGWQQEVVSQPKQLTTLYYLGVSFEQTLSNLINRGSRGVDVSHGLRRSGYESGGRKRPELGS